MYKIDLNETVFESDTDRGGCYVEVTRKGVPRITISVPMEELLFFVNDYYRRELGAK